jgi:hypothetical protein
MERVDKITSVILIVAIVVVGVLAGLSDINGDAALGFISGIAVSLVTATTARSAMNSNTNKSYNKLDPPSDATTESK